MIFNPLYNSKTILLVVLALAIVGVPSIDGFAARPLPSSSPRTNNIRPGARGHGRTGAASLFFAPVAPTDIVIESSSLFRAKCAIAKTAGGLLGEGVRQQASPDDIAAHALTDGSHLLSDLPSVLDGTVTTRKRSAKNLRLQYAQFAGRLMAFAVGFLPHHGFPAEEVAVQMVLLGVNGRPILRSIRLLQSVRCGQDPDCC